MPRKKKNGKLIPLRITESMLEDVRKLADGLNMLPTEIGAKAIEIGIISLKEAEKIASELAVKEINELQS